LSINVFYSPLKSIAYIEHSFAFCYFNNYEKEFVPIYFSATASILCLFRESCGCQYNKRAFFFYPGWSNPRKNPCWLDRISSRRERGRKGRRRKSRRESATAELYIPDLFQNLFRFLFLQFMWFITSFLY